MADYSNNVIEWFPQLNYNQSPSSYIKQLTSWYAPKSNTQPLMISKDYGTVPNWLSNEDSNQLIQVKVPMIPNAMSFYNQEYSVTPKITNATNTETPATETETGSMFNLNKYVNDNLGGWDNVWNAGKLGLGTLQAGMGIYGGLKQLGLAKDQFNFTKRMAEANLANSLKSYNTALEDRARARYAYQTGNANDADEYIKKHRL